MTTRLLALAFVLFAVSPCYAGEDPGRYTMTTVGDSVWRLDSATGAMSVCGQKLDHWACESVADDALALKAEVDRLARENRELKDKLAKAEEKETEADQLPGQPVDAISRACPRRDERFHQQDDPQPAGLGARPEAARGGAGALSLSCDLPRAALA